MTQKKKTTVTQAAVKAASALIGDKMPARRFEVRPSTHNNQWYWHAKAPNGKVTFQGEGHPTPEKAVRAIEQEMTALGALSDLHITVHGKAIQDEPKVIVKASVAHDSIRKEILRQTFGATTLSFADEQPARTKVSVKIPEGTKAPAAFVASVQEKIVKERKKPQVNPALAAAAKVAAQKTKAGKAPAAGSIAMPSAQAILNAGRPTKK